jgi:hypothetical protein
MNVTARLGGEGSQVIRPGIQTNPPRRQHRGGGEAALIYFFLEARVQPRR